MTCRLVLTGSAMLLVVSGCAAASDSMFVAGDYGPDDTVVITNMTIDTGRYEVGYSLDMRIVSAASDAVMTCQIVDTSGQFGQLEQTATQIVADSEWATVEFVGTYSLPDVTIGVRCSPDTEAQYAITVRNVALTAEPVPRSRS